VADGLRSESYRRVKAKGILKEVEVSGAIAEADAMVVVSHDKGHALTGFGRGHHERKAGDGEKVRLQPHDGGSWPRCRSAVFDAGGGARCGTRR
jgi:uncharacterized Fe-S center protein